MTAHSPSAYAFSVTLHGALIAALIFSAIMFRTESNQSAKIVELVAGEGDNYGATEAAALGRPDGIAYEKAELPPNVAQAEPEPSPVEAAPVPIEAIAPPKPEPKKPDLAQQMKRTAARAEQKVVTKHRKEQEAIARAEKAAELERKKMTEEEFRKQNAKAAASNKAAANSPVKVAKIDAEGIAKGVVGGSTSNKTGGAGGKVLSRAEQDELDSYFALLKQRLRDAHEAPSGVSDLLSARVQFYCSAGGVIGQVRIVQSSGNTSFDESVLAAFRKLSLPPRPDKRGDTHEVLFRMKDDL